METDFNRSKSKHSLAAFLGGVHEFKTGTRTVDAWAPSLLLTPPLLDAAAHTPAEVADAVAERTAAIRDDLKAFVRGERVPVS